MGSLGFLNWALRTAGFSTVQEKAPVCHAKKGNFIFELVMS